MRYTDFERVPGEVTVGGRGYGLFGHDWRAVPRPAWMSLLAGRGHRLTRAGQLLGGRIPFVLRQRLRPRLLHVVAYMLCAYMLCATNNGTAKTTASIQLRTDYEF